MRQLVLTGVGLAVGALVVWWPWQRTPSPPYLAPLDPTPPSMGEIHDGL